MALVQSKQMAAKVQFPVPDDARCPVVLSAEYVVPAGGRAVNDVIEMGVIPPDCVVVDGILHFTAGGASATGDFGEISGTAGDTSAATGQGRTCGNEYAAAINVASAGVARLAKNMTGAGKDNDGTAFGLKVTGATWPAGMIVRAHLIVRSELHGMV